jgi:small-conductance mechanosensitive channel
VLLLWATRRLFRWLVDWAERDVRRSVRDLASKAHDIVHAGQLWTLFAGSLRFLRTISYLVLIYFYLNAVLGLYPWTRPAARMLFRFILNPLRSLVIAFALVIAYPYIPGSDSLAFKGVSVFLGILLSLGSSSVIANLLAGLTMTYRGAFREGDRIRVGEIVGTVEEVKVMITRVRTPKNEIVIMPNSNIMSADVINYTQLAKTEGLLVHTTVSIGYDTPWRQVEAMLIEAAHLTGGTNKEPPPFVLQTSLGDFAAHYQLNAYCSDVNNLPRIYSDLHANIQDVFNAHGVQIMSPAYVADPETAKVVPPERWYAEPAKQPE